MTCIFEGNDDVSIVARPVLTQSAVNGLLCRIMCLSETHIILLCACKYAKVSRGENADFLLSVFLIYSL